MSCQCIVGCTACTEGGEDSSLGFGFKYCYSASIGKVEAVIGQNILSGNVLLCIFITYRLTFMAQHALLDFLGQDQVARLRSRPLEDYNSPCVRRAEPGGRTAQMCFVLS